jgi:hypothetical protein
MVFSKKTIKTKGNKPLLDAFQLVGNNLDDNNNNNNSVLLLKMWNINVIDRNASKCKYVEIFTHRNVGSIGAPSRRTEFIIIIIIIIVIIIIIISVGPFRSNT